MVRKQFAKLLVAGNGVRVRVSPSPPSIELVSSVAYAPVWSLG